MTQALVNQQWHYIKRPNAEVGPAHYRLVESAIDDQLASGEVLIANQYISVDPYMRIQQARGTTWEAPHPLNRLQQAGVVGCVIASASKEFQVGDWVTAYTGWEKFSKVHAMALSKLDPQNAPVTAALGVLGMPGRTAWFGLMEAGKPRPGETVVVSGAAGAVGSLVVQFAQKAGCKVVAFAGSKVKCDWLKDSLEVDLAINYRDFDDYEQLSQHLVERGIHVDVYFDNVGGMITDAVIPLLNVRARIIICGQMSQYNGQLDEVEMGPRFLHHMLYKRATIQGILARDFTHRMDEMVQVVAPWIKEGSIHFDEAIVSGFERLPEHLASLFDRPSHGKLIVKVGE
jgi:NADPH-dependent curcumin reductase CurA